MMRKILLSIIVILIMITAVIPSAIGADSTALSLLTYEMLSPQSPDCISENLNLPEEIGGVSLTWKSSDASVISTSGVVTRHESEEKAVTLTVTANGESKEFFFNVAPENYYVHYSDSFDYSDFSAKVITKLMPDWITRMGNAEYPSSTFRTETLSDGSKNCYIKNDMWKDRPQYHLNGVKPSGKIKVSYKVYMDLPTKTAGMFDYKFFFSSSSYVRMRFDFDADGKVKVTYTGKNSTDTIGSTKFDELNLLHRWVKMDFVMDTDSKKLWMYIDDELVTKESGLDSDKMTGPLHIVDFDLGTNVLNAVLGIDDVSVATMCENDAQRDVVEVYDLLSLEKFSSQSKFAVTENLDFSDVSFEGCDDVNITYKSGSDNLVIEGNTGKIIRSEEDAEAILYATITKDGTDISRTKTFEFTVKGSKYAVYDSEAFYYPDLAGERVTSESGGWELKNETSKEGLLDSAYAIEKGNYAVKAFRTASDSSLGVNDQNYFCYWFPETSKRDVTIETRFRTGKADKNQRKIYVVNLCGRYGTSKTVQTYTQMHIYMTQNGEISMDASSYNDSTGANRTVNIVSGIACPEEWFDFKMEVNMYAKTFSIYVNGKCVTPVPLRFEKASGVDIKTEAAGLSYFCANPFRTMSDCELYVDDFASYSTQGMYTDTIIYKNGERISDLGYLSQGDTLSADVQLYRYPEALTDNVNVVAAVYDGEKLYDVVLVNGKALEGKIKVNFPSIEFPAFVENMKLKIFCMSQAGGIFPVCEETVGEHKLNGTIIPTEHTDSKTGRTYFAIDLNGEDAVRSYYTMPIWSKDSKKFYFYDRSYRMYEYNTETYRYKYIDTLFTESTVMVSKLGNLFYLNRDKEIIRITPENEKTVVGTLPEEIKVSSATLLQVNNDESYLSLEIMESSGSSGIDTAKQKRIPVMNINTGEWDLRYVHGFDVVDYIPNHINMNPNPEYANLVAFAHEGRGSDCQGNPERIWLLNRDTGEISNLYKQKMSYGNVPEEVVSHEAWMQSGELMMFANGSGKVPGGITLFKTDGSDRRYVNFDYSYLHASGSTVTDRFVVSDTGYDGKTTNLVLIDCYTGKSYLLAVLPQSGVNPGHTHPNFSFDGNKVIFGVNSEDLKTMRIGWMDISDIIENVADGEEITLSETCSTTSYGGTDFYLEKTDNGYYIKEGNHMNVNITSFEKETADVELTFDYVDNGTKNIVIDYVKWETVNGKNKIVNYTEIVKRTNSGDIKTATVKLYGINAENLKIMGTDLTLKGEGSALVAGNVQAKEIKEN